LAVLDGRGVGCLDMDIPVHSRVLVGAEHLALDERAWLGKWLELMLVDFPPIYREDGATKLQAYSAWWRWFQVFTQN
jgi:hypothetical protein